MNTLVSALLHWRFYGTAKTVLSQDFERDTVNAIVAAAKQSYPNVPEAKLTETSFTVSIVLELSRLNIAFHDALCTADLTGEHVERLIDHTNWRLIRSSLGPLAKMSKLRGRGPIQMTRSTNRLLWKRIFTNPFMVTEVSTASIVAYDVKRCPMQEYYASQDRANVCRVAACNQDYRMADLWGVKLTRTQTLCNGGSVCDFRFTEKVAEATNSESMTTSYPMTD